jgi:hypothetical protein
LTLSIGYLGSKSLQQIGDDKYGKRKTKLLGIYEMRAPAWRIVDRRKGRMQGVIAGKSLEHYVGER